MDNSKYILLLHKKLSSGLSVEEEKTFQELSQSFSTDQVTNDVERIWDLSQNYRKDYQPNVEQALARFKTRLASDEKPTADVADTPTKVVPMQRRNFFRIAAAASVAVVLGASWMLGWFGGNENMQIVFNEASTPMEVKLSDGSIVWLNQNAELSYPEKFSWGERAVSLDGEAFFEVEADRKNPFIVSTNHGAVTVLGTAFNIRSIKGEPTEEVYVTEGIVEYLAESNQKTTLTKNQKAVFDLKKKNLSAAPLRRSNDLSWMTGELNFESEPLRDAITALERHYNITIQTNDISRILDCPVTLNVANQTADQAVKMISLAFQFSYKKVNDNTFRFFGGGQCY